MKRTEKNALQGATYFNACPLSSSSFMFFFVVRGSNRKNENHAGSASSSRLQSRKKKDLANSDNMGIQYQLSRSVHTIVSSLSINMDAGNKSKATKRGELQQRLFNLSARTRHSIAYPPSLSCSSAVMPCKAYKIQRL